MTEHQAATVQYNDQVNLRRDASPPRQLVGCVVCVEGTCVLVAANGLTVEAHSIKPQIGTMLTIDVGTHIIMGMISSISGPFVRDAGEPALIEVHLLGEFSKPSAQAPSRFQRGVSVYPSLGDKVIISSQNELNALYRAHKGAAVQVGVVKHDLSIPASLGVNELFAGHCAIVGAAGMGKSSATALIVNSVLTKYPHAHLVVFDQYFQMDLVK